MKPIVIIGAGMAGYTVARELRKLDKQIPITIVTADDGDFYSKPMLSNAFALDKQADQLITQTADQMRTQLNADILTWMRVGEIDTSSRIVQTDCGATLAYEKLVMAVGAYPITVPLGGDAALRVLSVNSLRDYTVFRKRLALINRAAPIRIAILGAGLIGCEFADDLSSAGYQVNLIDPNPLPLAALAAPALSQGLHDALIERGVIMHLGTTATRVDDMGDNLQVSLANGVVFRADIVLSAVGLRPSLKLAHTAQLHTNRGIVVDAYGQASAQDVYALGDCAEYAMPDGSRRPLPYIAPLVGAARAIAKTLSGQPTAIDWKPAPVIVKTPSYPLALLPPSPGIADGKWHAAEENDKTVCRYIDDSGVIHGFGVAPQEAGVRQALLNAIGTKLEFKAAA